MPLWSNTTAIMGQWWGINSPWRKENAPEVLATMEDMIGVASREELARILCTAEFCECCDYKKTAACAITSKNTRTASCLTAVWRPPSGGWGKSWKNFERGSDMNKTKIDWATMSWNPVTGCRHGCPYCYARRTAHRFDAGCADPDPLADGLHVLEEKIKDTPYPYGFEPTMHRYRLNQPERQAEPQTVFVCSMADLFGRWVPTSWIAGVLDACRRAPQHRYLFLTKNPARYLQLDYMGILPHENNFWYGSTVANEDAAAMYTMQGVAINSFWSMEPLLGPVDMSAAEGLPQWVILGAETGNRADKVTPRREWVDQITQFCAENEIPVFYKDNLRAHFPDLPPSASPWDDREDATTEWAAHYMGRFERQV